MVSLTLIHFMSPDIALNVLIYPVVLDFATDPLF